MMLTDYVAAAMHKAKYKILNDEEGYFGEIPGFRGSGRMQTRWKRVARSCGECSKIGCW
jgi:hypothetical protein